MTKWLESWLIERERTKVRCAELRLEEFAAETAFRNAPCLDNGPHDYKLEHKYQTLYTKYCTKCGRSETV